MSNPGPASTQTAHPSNLATNQALRLLASAQGVNLNSVGDTVANIVNRLGNISVQSVIVANASVDLTTAQLAVYTGPGATGTAIKTATTAVGIKPCGGCERRAAQLDAATPGWVAGLLDRLRLAWRRVSP